MRDATQKAYAKREIAMAHLVCFVNDMFNNETNDGVKYYKSNGYII